MIKETYIIAYSSPHKDYRNKTLKKEGFPQKKKKNLETKRTHVSYIQQIHRKGNLKISFLSTWEDNQSILIRETQIYKVKYINNFEYVFLFK